MGWTHHWQRPLALPKDRFALVVEDCRRLLDAHIGIVAGPEGIGRPVITASEILFNGQHPLVCEPFEFRRVERYRHGRERLFTFCKTEHLPYDLLVQAALIVAKHYLGSLVSITSDGGDGSWKDARELVANHLAYGIGFVLDGSDV